MSKEEILSEIDNCLQKMNDYALMLIYQQVTQFIQFEQKEARV